MSIVRDLGNEVNSLSERLQACEGEAEKETIELREEKEMLEQELKQA